MKRNQRIRIYEEQIALTDAKVFYKQADMWIAAEDAGKTIAEDYEQIESTTEKFVEALEGNAKDLDAIGEYAPAIEKNNAGLLDEISDILEWE